MTNTPMSTVTPDFGSVTGLSTIRPPHPPPLGAELIGEAGLGDIGAHQDEFAIGRKWGDGRARTKRGVWAVLFSDDEWCEFAFFRVAVSDRAG